MEDLESHRGKLADGPMLQMVGLAQLCRLSLLLTCSWSPYLLVHVVSRHSAPWASFCAGCLWAGGLSRASGLRAPAPRELGCAGLCLQERFVVHVTDVLAVAMMLGITAQVKEAGTAWDKGEKKSKDPGQTGRHPA